MVDFKKLLERNRAKRKTMDQSPEKGTIDAFDLAVRKSGVDFVIAQIQRTNKTEEWKVAFLKEGVDKAFDGKGKKFSEAARQAFKKIIEFKKGKQQWEY